MFQSLTHVCGLELLKREGLDRSTVGFLDAGVGYETANCLLHSKYTVLI